MHGFYNRVGCCQFNSYVDCENKKKCKTCGWNPSVEEERKYDIRNPKPITRTKWCFVKIIVGDD